MRLWLAIRLFFRTFFDRRFADAARQLADEGMPSPSKPSNTGEDLPPRPSPARPPRSDAGADVSAVRSSTSSAAQASATKSASAQRNDAVALLAMLQREARFVDIVSEPLEQYNDAQIGAAARDILRDCRQVVQRVFALQPVAEAEEGAMTEIPLGYDPVRFRLLGEAVGKPPLRGNIVHRGWEATRCELPQWTGSYEGAMVVAPAEVQIDSSTNS